jgi:hypothetical protein
MGCRGTGVGIFKVEEGWSVTAKRVGASVGRRGLKAIGGMVGTGVGVGVGVFVNVGVGGGSVGVGHGVHVPVGVHVGGSAVGSTSVNVGEEGNVAGVSGHAATVAGGGKCRVQAM